MFSSSWSLLICALLGFVSLAKAFTPEEVQIFQLQQELVKTYRNPDLDFYKMLKLPKLRDSSSAEIRKNLRKLAKTYHPDKNKKYRKLYERLSLATKILENDSQRKIYDYYLKNGFPNYDFKKGGFYFTRVQPKVWAIGIFIFLSCGLIHFIILRLQNDGNKNRIERFLREVKAQDDTLGLGEKRLLFRQNPDEEGREIIVRFGEVYAVQSDGKEALISTKDIVNPGISDSLLLTLPLWMWRKSVGCLFNFTTSVKNTNELPENKPSSEDSKPKPIRIHGSGEKLELPNGKVVRSRKKN
ncbi:LADA_0G15808g1_1 [Lachancea dasiensis]|uniref:LADA_0G15808g1_1 n=1 Tax=Lachancea dasiensis TaxID=1072105 RepID=A0A1G4JWX6_9SACH|nr:LADA_0G15808g1_1 [Lachancea dasiensis]